MARWTYTTPILGTVIHTPKHLIAKFYCKAQLQRAPFRYSVSHGSTVVELMCPKLKKQPSSTPAGNDGKDIKYCLKLYFVEPSAFSTMKRRGKPRKNDCTVLNDVKCREWVRRDFKFQWTCLEDVKIWFHVCRSRNWLKTTDVRMGSSEMR